MLIAPNIKKINDLWYSKGYPGDNYTPIGHNGPVLDEYGNELKNTDDIINNNHSNYDNAMEGII